MTDNLFAVIEIPQDSLLKYEFDKTQNALVVDRVLNRPVPFNYGYIPNTLSPDRDPLDVFVLGDIPIHPLARVRVEVLGVLKCIDNGDQDDKLVCRMVGPRLSWTRVDTGVDLIRNYLETYKPGFIVQGYEEDTALDVLKACQDEYRAHAALGHGF